MSWFSKEKKHYVGVDIGSGSVKVVELSKEKNKPQLVTYGYVDAIIDVMRTNRPEAQKKVVTALKKLISSARVSTNQVTAALPTYSVFNSIITLPTMATKDLARAVSWEAKKYVPMPLTEMVLDWKIISNENKKSINDFKANNSEKNKLTFTAPLPSKTASTRVLITAAPKNLVARYVEIFKAANLRLLSLETEAFALARALIGPSASQTVMIIDVGATTSDLSIVQEGIPILNRTINIGGQTLTRAIADSMNVSFDRAEQFKRDFGVSLMTANNQKGIPQTMLTALAPLLNEVKYVFDLYQNQNMAAIEKIILSGGSAFIPNLSELISSQFNKPLVIGNPWDTILYPKDLETVLQENGPRLSVAIGLALREF
jgi:type IV pilus assembly protein PilM